MKRRSFKTRHVDIDDVVNLYDSGLSFEKVSRRVGCSIATVRNMYTETGRKPRPRQYYYDLWRTCNGNSQKTNSIN